MVVSSRATSPRARLQQRIPAASATHHSNASMTARTTQSQMPNSKQAKKRMETDDLRRMRNKTVRTSMRTAVKNVLSAETAEAASAALPTAFKRVDKAAKTNVIHDNTAARKKSQLQRHIAKLNG